jgi:cobalt-zinc-cadmium efflux system membrane fusion protein
MKFNDIQVFSHQDTKTQRKTLTAWCLGSLEALSLRVLSREGASCLRAFVANIHRFTKATGKRNIVIVKQIFRISVPTDQVHRLGNALKAFTILALLIPTLLTFGCGKKKTEQAAMNDSMETEVAEDRVVLTESQFATLGITTGKVSRRAIRSTITTNGVLDVPPQNMVSIAAPFGGFLKNTNLLPGSRVSRGQVVATLEHPDFITMQQEWLENKSQATFLEAEFQRQTALANENVNARKTLEKAKADFESMKARLAGQRAKLEMLHIDMTKLERGEIVREVNIHSPIAGYVTQMNVNIGSYVQPTDALFKIADTGHLHAELTVYEQDIPKLAIGQKVNVHVGNETKNRLATIHLLGREVGADRSVKVHVHFDEEDPLLIPGTFLKAEIEVLTADATVLPEKAVVQFEGKNFIFVEDGKLSFEMIAIEKGSNDSGFVGFELPSTISMESEIVVEGAYDLLTKLKNTEEE